MQDLDIAECHSCRRPLGIHLDPLNEPDSIMMTCRCGAINVWRPR